MIFRQGTVKGLMSRREPDVPARGEHGGQGESGHPPGEQGHRARCAFGRRRYGAPVKTEGTQGLSGAARPVANMAVHPSRRGPRPVRWRAPSRVRVICQLPADLAGQLRCHGATSDRRRSSARAVRYQSGRTRPRREPRAPRPTALPLWVWCSRPVVVRGPSTRSGGSGIRAFQCGCRTNGPGCTRCCRVVAARPGRPGAPRTAAGGRSGWRRGAADEASFLWLGPPVISRWTERGRSAATRPGQ